MRRQGSSKVETPVRVNPRADYSRESAFSGCPVLPLKSKRMNVALLRVRVSFDRVKSSVRFDRVEGFVSFDRPVAHEAFHHREEIFVRSTQRASVKAQDIPFFLSISFRG